MSFRGFGPPFFLCPSLEPHSALGFLHLPDRMTVCERYGQAVKIREIRKFLSRSMYKCT